MYDILIKGGQVIDGSGRPALRQDVAVSGDSIAATGPMDAAEAGDFFDADGLYVCPGFIDIHSHSEFNILVDPPGQAKVRQGVTTEVCGNCGLSPSPMRGQAKVQREESLRRFGVQITWETLAGFAEVVAQKQLLTNIAPLVGHGNLRGSVIGYENRKASPEEIKAMQALLVQDLRSGAWGMSSGLIYPPGVFADREELVDLAGAVRDFGGIYSSHIRSESDEVIQALAEVLETGRRAGVPVQISHLKTMGKRNWAKLPAVFDCIERAIEAGVEAAADRYPYTASGTGLDAVLPAWACQGGTEREVARLQGLRERKKIIAEMLRTRTEEALAGEVMISRVASRRNRSLEGSLLGQAAEQRKQPVCEALCDLLVEERLDVDAIFFCMSEENLKEVLKKNYVMIGSDASARDIQGPLAAGKPHPRGFGTFPRLLRRYVLDDPLLGLEEAVAKMTGRPAEIMGFADRGLIRRGAKADIVIFSRDDLGDCATYAHPHAFPSGLVRVMVNGRWVVKEGAFTGNYPGRLLLKS